MDCSVYIITSVHINQTLGPITSKCDSDQRASRISCFPSPKASRFIYYESVTTSDGFRACIHRYQSQVQLDLVDTHTKTHTNTIARTL